MAHAAGLDARATNSAAAIDMHQSRELAVASFASAFSFLSSPLPMIFNIASMEAFFAVLSTSGAFWAACTAARKTEMLPSVLNAA